MRYTNLSKRFGLLQVWGFVFHDKWKNQSSRSLNMLIHKLSTAEIVFESGTRYPYFKALIYEIISVYFKLFIFIVIVCFFMHILTMWGPKIAKLVYDSSH